MEEKRLWKSPPAILGCVCVGVGVGVGVDGGGGLGVRVSNIRMSEFEA